MSSCNINIDNCLGHAFTVEHSTDGMGSMWWHWYRLLRLIDRNEQILTEA